MIEKTEKWLVPVSAILSIWNPLDDDIWGCGAISELEIMERYHSDTPLPQKSRVAFSSISDCIRPAKGYHIDRIVHMMRNQSEFFNEDDDMPIIIDCYDETDEWYAICDGNHRLIASRMIGKEFVWVEPTGDLDYIEELIKPVSKIYA